MRWIRPARFLAPFAVLGFAISFAPLHLQAGSDLEQHLRDQCNGKTLVLRGFLHGDHLHYDLEGMPTGSAHPGDWTVDGFVRVTSLEADS